MPVGATTLLRRIREADLDPPLPPRILGVDAAVLNWAESWACMVFKGQWAVPWRRPVLP
jgi:hypothetical protein